MTTQERIYKQLAKKKKNTNLKKQKVALGLVDDFQYQLQDLEDEVGRLSYSVEEWFDEKFEEFYKLRGDLRDVYINNSEAFLSAADVAGDSEILDQIKEKAEELGLLAEEVYPDWQIHYDTLEYLDQLESRFDDQVSELRSIGVE